MTPLTCAEFATTIAPDTDYAEATYHLVPRGLTPRLASAQGMGTTICVKTNSVRIVTDAIRSAPVYWKLEGSELTVSSKFQKVGAGRRILDTQSAFEFLNFGYVLSDRSVLQGVRATSAGTVCELKWSGRSWVETSTVNSKDVPGWHPQYKPSWTSQPDTQDFMNMHMETMESVLGAFEGRRPVIPLSGGRDSSLLACSLRAMGVKDALCFTYGDVDDPEVRASKANAHKLGFRWKRVPYNEGFWSQASRSEGWKEYLFQGGGAVAIPHVQDWPAVSYLEQTGEIGRSDVFLPGHSGDFVAGSHLRVAPNRVLSVASRSERWALRELHRVHGGITPSSVLERFVPDRQAARRRTDGALLSELADWDDARRPDVVSWLDSWDWQNRQAKFIANSVTAYACLGYGWALPQWSLNYREFWRACSLDQRLDMNLYISATSPMLARWDVQLSRGRTARLPRFARRVGLDLAKAIAKHAPVGLGGKDGSYGWTSLREGLDGPFPAHLSVNAIVGVLSLLRLTEGG